MTRSWLGTVGWCGVVVTLVLLVSCGWGRKSDKAATDEKVDELVRQLSAPDPDTRKNAAQQLGAMGAAAKAAVPALARIVEDSQIDYFTRMEAARALGQIGPAARDAIPALTSALKTQNPRPAAGDNGNLRLEFAAALTRIDPDNAYARQNLNDCLTDPNGHVRVMAAYELARLNPTPEAVQRLAGMLKTAGIERPKVIDSLGKLGPAAKDAVPALSELVKQGPGEERIPAAVALVRIDPQGAIPVVKPLLTGDDRADVTPIIEALGEAGPAAKDAAPTLRALQSRQGGRYRPAATRALEKIDGK
jgi:HEAT repeat protein